MDKLNQINRRLKAAKIGVTIEARGDRLSLRATLPPKPGEAGGSRQQRIPLGILANGDGLRFAESEAKVVGGLLAQERFDWNRYLRIDRPSETIAYWIEKLKDQYFSEREETPTTLETWHHDYWRPLSLLPKDNLLPKNV
jgi:hypothetical protein